MNRSRRFERCGSAYLFVIGVISVLTVIVIFFFKSTTAQRFSTRMMSDEKKAEAVAESAVDLTMGFVKERMNKGDDLNFYPFFRYPCALTKNSIGADSGKNIPLNLANYDEPIEMGVDAPALKPLAGIIDELGGSDNVKLKVECRVSYAEAFSAGKEEYQVVGISKKSAEAVGLSAQFLDSMTKLDGSGDGSLSSFNGDWKIDFKLPNATYNDKHELYINGIPSIADVESEVDITRMPPYDSELKVRGEIRVKVTVPVLGTVFELSPPDDNASMTIDVMTYIRDFLNIDPSYPLLTIEAIRDQSMEGDHNMPGLQWQAGNLIAEIKDDYNSLPAAIKGKLPANPYGDKASVVEKTGILQIKAVVEFMPNGPEGKKIEKTLVANRPFKVTDFQPPAPEYSFFVANSNLLFEGNGDNPFALSLGSEINWSPTYSVASICISNLPDGEYETLTGLSGSAGGAGKKCQVPGMVRINSRNEMSVNTYIGTTLEPDLTEFNALLNKKNAPLFNVIPTFAWNDTSIGRIHEFEFPVIRETDWIDDYTPPGFRNLLNIISLCTALEAPNQFFGRSFIGYPLGMCLEAKMKQRYANMVLKVKPTGKADAPHDISEIHIRYINKEKKYGIQGHEGYNSSSWSPDNYINMPANLYSLMQYAKKATHFYRTEEEFWKDSTRFSDGVYLCDGVTYIMGTLNIDKPLEVKGKGILVAKTNILISEDVKRADDAVFSLIARAGYLHFKGNCKKVEAACYSNSSPIIENTDRIEINGNLVVNDFNRSTVDFLEVNFNSAACRVSPLSVMRDVGKFDPKRYIVTVADNWSSYKFAKKD